MEEYTQITLNDWVQMKERLKRDLIGVQESFVRIGYTLRKIEDQQLYKQDGYKNITEFAKAEYGLNPSTVSRFKAINRKYSVDGYSDQLRPEFAQFGSSKLSEMLSLPEQDMEMITPEATRESIRELKQFNKEEPEAGVADDVRELIKKFFEENSDVLDELRSSEAYQTGDIKRMTEIVKPGDDRTYRKGLYFLVMYDREIKAKKYGSLPQVISWETFFSITEEIITEQTAAVPEDETEQTKTVSSDEAEQTAAVPEDKAEQMAAASEDEAEQMAAVNADRISDMGEIAKKTEVKESVIEKSVEEEMPNLRENIEFEGGCQTEKIAPAQKKEETLSVVQDDKAETIDGTAEKESEQIADDRESGEYADDSEADETGANNQKHESEPESEAETEQGTAAEENNSENVRVPERTYMTRNEYMNTLTPYKMAHYLVEEYERHNLLASMLAYPSQIIDWLVRDVDDQGRDIVDV